MLGTVGSKSWLHRVLLALKCCYIGSEVFVISSTFGLKCSLYRVLLA